MVIAIDGFSSCGKSTLAKATAKALGYAYVDSGAMYRCVTLYCLRNNVDINNEQEVANALANIDIAFKNIGGENTTFMNGENVEKEIRGMEVSAFVSPVAAIEQVRTNLVGKQKGMGSEGHIVMDGRDIGTTVFPNADMKFFIVSDHAVRARRRFDEMIAKGKNTTLEKVIENLQSRDEIDTSRKVSPLRKAEDAIEIDNTYLTKEEQLDLVLYYIEKLSN